MSVKKNFITLDSTDLFDDSDIDDEISSFLQEYESKHKPSQKSSGKEVKIEQKDVQVTKTEQTITSGVKSTKENVNSKQTTKSDQKDASAEKTTKIDVKCNQDKKNNKKSVSDAKSTKSDLVTQINKKTSEVTLSKIHEQEKAIKGEKVLSKNSGGTHMNSKSSLKDIALDDVDLEFLITDKKDEERKSVEPYPCCSPISSVGSELFDSTELEQEIQSFLGKELPASEDRKQSGNTFKDKCSVSVNAKTTKNVSDVNSEKVQNESVKVVQQTVKTETSKTLPTKHDQVELQKEKFKKLNQDEPKLQKEKTGRLETQPTKVDQIEIGSVSKEIKSKDGVKEKQSSDKNMKDKTSSGDDSAKEIPKMQEKIDCSLKIEGKIVVNDNIAIPKMQDSRKEIQQTSLSNKGKTEVNTTKSKIQDSKKETQKSDLSNKGKTEANSAKPGVQDSEKETQKSDLLNKGKTEVNTAKPGVQDSKKETQTSDLSNKGKTEVNATKPGVQESKKETQQTNLSNKGKTEGNTAKPGVQESKKETQQTNLSNKGKTEGNTTKPGVQESKKETQQTNLSNKGKPEVNTAKPGVQEYKKETQQINLSNKGKTELNTGKSDIQDSKKETQQTNLSNKGKTEVNTAKPGVQESKKETQQTNLSNKGKTEVNTAKPGVQESKNETQQTNLSNKGKTELNAGKSDIQCSKRETQQSVLSNKGKTEVIPAKPGVQDSKNDAQQLGSSGNGKTESKIVPELGIIIEDYEKEEGDKKYGSKDQELCIGHNESDVTSEGTKQVNKRRLEENSESESDSKKSKKGYFTSSDYEKQLESKITDIKDKLSRSSDFIINKYSKESTISRNILRNNGLVCDLDDMRKCPSNEWMATICSFVIGVGRLSNDLIVGFKEDNSENKKTFNPTVKSISEVVHNYPDHVIGAAKVFEKMIQVHARGKGGRPHPHGVNKVWKELSIYTNKRQELMLIIRVSADSTLIIKEIYNLYVDFFKNGEGKKFRVTSVYITCYYKIGNHDDCWIEHLTGNQSLKIFKGLYVNFVGLVEPWSNMYGLKMLCRAVEELLMPTRNTTVLEIFCCTGLLGHYLSKIAGEVLAYDDPDVIRSTRKNATRNNITSVQYFSGDPQSELLYRIEMARCGSLTAVVNWNPNLNRHVSICLAMKILREVKKLQKLVVVATSNTLSHIPFRTLCAPYDMERGEPFFPVKAIPIDTMPLQDGYTVAVLFKRQFESVKQECSKHVPRPKVKEEWWNWIKDDESKDIHDEERKGERTNEERKDDDRQKKRNDEEEKKQKLEEQMKRMIHGELRKRKEEMEKIREEGGDRRERRRFDHDDRRDEDDDEDNDREYVYGMWRRKKKEDEKNRKIMEEERKRKMEQEGEERKRQVEEEMKKKIQEQLDKRRQEEIERMQKAQEELRRKEEEERQKKEMQEKAKRLTFFRKRLKEEQRRRAQEDQKVEIEKEQTDEEMVAKKKKEIEEDQKKLAQIKDKKKQLEEEEKKKPLEQLRRQIEEEKVRAKRTAERKRLAQIEEKKRKVEEEERRQQLGNQRIPVWEQPPLEVGILEQRKLEGVYWRILEEEKYRRSLEEEAYRKVENDTVVFDYNHGSTVSSAVAKQEEAKRNVVESSTPVTPSNAVSRPVMKWLEKLREVSGDVDVKGKSSTGNTSNNQQTSKATPPSLLSLHVEKPTSLPSSSDGIASGPFRPVLEKPMAPPPPLLSFHVEKPSSFVPTSSDGNVSRLLSAPIRPLLQPPGFLKVSGRDDHLPEVGRSNVGTSIRQSSLSAEPSRPLIEPFGEQQGLSSIAFGEQQSFCSKKAFSEQQGFSSVGFGEQQGISSIPFGSHKSLSSVPFGSHDNLSKGRYSYGGIGRNDSQENTTAGPRGMADLYGSRDAPSVNNLYGFVGSGRYDDPARNSGDSLMRGIPNTRDIHSTDSFSFKKTLQDMKTYNPPYSGQGQY